MADEIVAEIASITGAAPNVAAQYAQLADGDLNQAITLYFENGGADLSGQAASSSSQNQEQTQSHTSGYEDPSGIIHIDSDDEDTATTGRGNQNHGTNTYDSDLEMARRMQEEMYGIPNTEDEVRAPIARQAETLVGPGAEEFGGMDDVPSAVMQQMRAIQNRRTAGRPGIFNQQTSSIWNNDGTDAQSSSIASAGTSEASRKSNLLADLYRPPFDLMFLRSWDEARDEGKEHKKWLLVNIQDPSIFDCQILNRDIWKNEGIVETVKEHFIFLQYSKDDPRAAQYLQYYFQNYDSPDAYPHIAILDPRTGEQVKTWSGPPSPKAADFLIQLHEFLDRYSLRSNAKMPVARRKPEVKKEQQISQMSEEEQMELALKASMQGQSSSNRHEDPDDLTRSIVDMDKEKGKAAEVIDLDDVDMYEVGDAAESTPQEAPPTDAFSGISSNNLHTEPDQSPATTRIAFRHPAGRVIRKFLLSDSVRRIYEWLKSSPLEGKEGARFDLIFSGKNLIDSLDESIENAGLKNGTVMIEYIEDE